MAFITVNSSRMRQMIQETLGAVRHKPELTKPSVTLFVLRAVRNESFVLHSALHENIAPKENRTSNACLGDCVPE